ncbi:UNVERIFIED_CONTAM: hypothetical protein GTU68_037522, partial [Idotea baltica]|nr:hypothetical protein [Idotea baltica]
TCDNFDPEYYPKFKNWADDYFYIPHRKETRGVGGIFFDRLQSQESAEKQNIFEFVQKVGETFIPAYFEQLEIPLQALSEADIQWQRYRRSRYVEFNLVHDKGTKFGLDTDGRIESILMSLPPLAAWDYDPAYAKSEKAQETRQWLQKGIDWINIKC